MSTSHKMLCRPFRDLWKSPICWMKKVKLQLDCIIISPGRNGGRGGGGRNPAWKSFVHKLRFEWMKMFSFLAKSSTSLWLENLCETRDDEITRWPPFDRMQKLVMQSIFDTKLQHLARLTHDNRRKNEEILKNKRKKWESCVNSTRIANSD